MNEPKQTLKEYNDSIKEAALHVEQDMQELIVSDLVWHKLEAESANGIYIVSEVYKPVLDSNLILSVPDGFTLSIGYVFLGDKFDSPDEAKSFANKHNKKILSQFVTLPPRDSIAYRWYLSHMVELGYYSEGKI